MFLKITITIAHLAVVVKISNSSVLINDQSVTATCYGEKVRRRCGNDPSC